MSFEVKGGEKVGVVGRTGAGKSSLCLALFRIVEAEAGQILIDGEDISEMGLLQLRSKITIIPQEPVLFKGTLRYNLDPLGDSTEEETFKVVRKARLEELLVRAARGCAPGKQKQNTEDGQRKMNGILELEISENVGNLSAGERQLVCICRAVLRKNRIVVMDEATASIDLATEEII